MPHADKMQMSLLKKNTLPFVEIFSHLCYCEEILIVNHNSIFFFLFYNVLCGADHPQRMWDRSTLGQNEV